MINNNVPHLFPHTNEFKDTMAEKLFWTEREGIFLIPYISIIAKRCDIAGRIFFMGILFVCLLQINMYQFLKHTKQLQYKLYNKS